LLVKSGYDLDSNYESEKINNFKLPEVHREIGPIPIKRAIKVSKLRVLKFTKRSLIRVAKQQLIWLV
jgi:hypothetical protein